MPQIWKRPLMARTMGNSVLHVKTEYAVLMGNENMRAGLRQLRVSRADLRATRFL
jgi:hypothetical protein